MYWRNLPTKEVNHIKRISLFLSKEKISVAFIDINKNFGKF